ncbi:MAG: cell division ATP-binding protein FtsE [Flavobacterium sp.]
METPIISLKNITVTQEKNTIIKNLNFEVFPGEFIYIIGKTGVGKSSLMKILYADLDFVEGEAEVVGYNLKNIKDKNIPFLRRKLGIVFQDFKLLTDRSIFENLDFVLKATGWKNKIDRQNKIEEVLEKTAVKDKMYKLPHQISGGEQQRVAIARALLNDADVILADEPTGNLDPHSSLEIMELLQELNRNGKTIIMATHDYALIMKYKSKTIKIEDSSLFEVETRSK